MLIRNSKGQKNNIVSIVEHFYVCIIKTYARHDFKHPLVCCLFELNAQKSSSIVET